MSRLLPTATGLLSRLSNPLNVTLLATQLLSSPALYPRPVDLAACRRIFSLFYTAATQLAEHDPKPVPGDVRSNLSQAAWIKAVIQGANEKSPRWRHLLLIGGLLLGSTSQGQRLPSDLRTKLEQALVTASNLALDQGDDHDANSQFCIAFVLNHTFPSISDFHRSQLRYDLLLPVLIEGTYFSREGLEHGYWLGMIDVDVRPTDDRKFSWSSRSTSFAKVQDINSRALVGSLGPLARLTAHTIEHVQDSMLVLAAVDRIAEFSRNLALSWRQNKLSEIAKSEEGDYLDPETLTRTHHLLFQLLRNTFFAMIITLRAALGRLLCDNVLAADASAPFTATQCLHILRDTYFISHRFGQTSSSQYIFINYTAIDILNQYSVQAESFLASIRSPEIGKVPAHPLERMYDLFFLNTVEHFTLTVSERTNEELLLAAAMPYIRPSGDHRLSEIYEAAHSVLLAVFAAPQSAGMAARHAPIYVETLMQSFPQVLSSRQFRLAIKSIVRLAAAPSPMSSSIPLMQETILDLLLQRAQTAPEEPLLADAEAVIQAGRPPLSERAVLVLAIIDSLCFLSVLTLEEWLPIAAGTLHKLNISTQRDACQLRFWEVLSNGDMDVERAVACVTWWNGRGGKELTVFGLGSDEEEFMMSGAVQQESKL